MATMPAVTSSIPDWILWLSSARGDVNNAKDISAEVQVALENGDFPLARFQAIRLGELLDEATKKIQLALR